MRKLKKLLLKKFLNCKYEVSILENNESEKLYDFEVLQNYVLLSINQAQNYLNDYIEVINSIIETTLNYNKLNHDTQKNEELFALYNLKASVFKNYSDGSNKKKYVETAYDCYIKAVKICLFHKYFSLYSVRLFYSYVKFLCLKVKDVYRAVLFTNQFLTDFLINIQKTQEASNIIPDNQISKVKKVLCKFSNLKDNHFNSYMEKLKHYYPHLKEELTKL